MNVLNFFPSISLPGSYTFTQALHAMSPDLFPERLFSSPEKDSPLVPASEAAAPRVGYAVGGAVYPVRPSRERDCAAVPQNGEFDPEVRAETNS